MPRYSRRYQASHQRNLDCNRKENEMKVTDLDTKEVTVTRTEKRYVLNEKVFELDGCPDWAQYAAVNGDGTAYFYRHLPFLKTHSYACKDSTPWHCYMRITKDVGIFDPTDWQNSLIERPKKVLEVTMADLEKKFGCKVKIVKEN